MSAIRFPKIAQIRELPIVGPAFADLLEAAGITDEDLPDIIRDDIDYENPELVLRDFPKLAALVSFLETADGEDRA